MYTIYELRARKKLYSESIKDYLIAMTGLARLISLDDSALIEYIICGIIDDERNKVVLYGANTLDELKARIETYERMKEAMKEARRPGIPSTVRVLNKANSASTESKQGSEKPFADSASKGHTKKPFMCYNCNSA